MVEERFRTEYLIAIVVAVVLLLIISLVVTTLFAMRCQRSRAKRLRAAAIESSELQRSRSGGDLSNTDTVATQVKKMTKKDRHTDRQRWCFSANSTVNGIIHNCLFLKTIIRSALS